MFANGAGEFVGIVRTTQFSPHRQAYIAGTAEGYRAIAAQGEQLPGFEPGTVLNAVDSLRVPHISEDGRIAFLGRFSGPGAGSATPVFGIFLSDLAGNLELVARSGQEIVLAPGDIRTIDQLELPGNAGGLAAFDRAMSDNRLLVYYAHFTDGSTAIMRAVIPTPSTALPLLCLPALHRRRR